MHRYSVPAGEALCFETMFENWDGEFSSPLRRVADRPKPVLVELGKAIVTHSPFRKEGVGLRVKAAGLDLKQTVPGLLYAWARAADGTWLGLCAFRIPTADGRGHVDAQQWCPAPALSEPGNRRNMS